MTPSQPAPTTVPPESSPTSSVRQDLTRIALAVICLLLLIGTTLWVLRPFLAAGVWATMLVVSTWPLLKSLQARLGNRRAPAVALMTLGLLLLLILPLWAAIDTIAGHADEVTALAKTLADVGLAAAAGVGARSCPSSARRSRPPGRDAAQAGPDGLVARLAPYASDAVSVGARPRRQRGRPAGPLPPGRGPLRHPVRQRRNGGERRCAASAGAWRPSAARTPSSWPGRPFGPWRWGSA